VPSQLPAAGTAPSSASQVGVKVSGPPLVRLHGKAASLARAAGIGDDAVAVTISHAGEYAVAVATIRAARGR
jgi:phosphopantetheinyl transferase (holo-ACP synthase)